MSERIAAGGSPAPSPPERVAFVNVQQLARVADVLERLVTLIEREAAKSR